MSWPDSWLLPVLQQAGMVTELDVPRLRETGAASAWAACVLAGVASDEWILGAVAERFRMPVADVAAVTGAAAALLPGELARRLRVLPLAFSGQVLEVACSDPTDADLERAVAFGAGKRVRLRLAAPSAIELALQRLYPQTTVAPGMPEDAAPSGVRRSDGSVRQLEEILASGEAEPPIPELVDSLIVRGLRLGASDLHLEPTGQAFVVRYRVDGVLHESARLPRSSMVPLVNRLKIMASLDIADRLRPQDGRAQVALAGRTVDLLVSSLPVSGLGEKVVVRILDSEAPTTHLDQLGFDPAELAVLKEMLNRKEGLVLVAGPTGGGKTTTLYAALRTMQSPAVNIVTVEDPIEYRLEGVSQVQVNENAGLTFATTLRTVLRQDPNVVLVGEIRDRETAELAIQAALSRRLVLATMQTSDVAGTIGRLVDLGVDLSSLATALRGVVAQRLLRRVCPSCGKPMAAAQLPLAQQALLSGHDVGEVCAAVGCPECHGTGYRGRLAVAELGVMAAEVQRAIARGARLDELAEACGRAGMRSLWESGLRRVVQGRTTLHELLDNVAAPPVAASAQPTGPSAEGAMRQEDIDALVQQMLSQRGAPAAGATPASTPPPPAPGAGSQSWQSRVDAMVQQALANRSVVPATASPADSSAAPPAAPQATATPPTPAAPPQVAPGHGPRVLLVDEDGESRRQLREGLTAEGFRVLEACDGETALEYVRRVGPAAVVLELAMPRLDGFGILRALEGGVASASGRRPLCVVLTVQDDPDVAAWVRELGAADYIVKPVPAEAVAARLRALLESAVA